MTVIKKFISLLTVLFVPLLVSQSAVIFSKPKFFMQPADISHFPPLEIGDWVLRAGTVIDSQIIMEVSQGEYSHIGMIVQTKPQILVIHATTDDGYKEKNQVFLSPLEEFLSPQLAKNAGIFRPHFLTSEQKQHIASRLMQQKGQPFVLAPKDQSHQYCTTLLEAAIQTEYPDFLPKWERVTTPLFEGEYLFPKAFVEYPNTEKLPIHFN